MMVLFIGSRGSGKTTISTMVYDQLMQRGYRCARQFPGLQRRPIARAVYTAVSLWRFFDPTLFRVLGFRGRAPRWVPSLYRAYVPLAVAHDMEKIRTGEADILLYDSNILRALIAGVADTRVDIQEIVSLCQHKILPRVGKMLIVLLDTDPAEAVARWMARDAVDLSDAEKARAIAERARTYTASEAVTTALQTLPGIFLMRSDGSADPEHNATKIVTKIEEVMPEVH